MKRILLPLLAALALPNAMAAGIDPAVHNLCKDVSDYAGCVIANKDFDPQEIKKLNIFGFKYSPMVGRDFKGTIFVIGIIKGSSADKAGLKFGDQILRVNDEFLSKEDPEQSFLKIREATKNKKLKLKIARYSLKKNKKGRNVEVLDIEMNKNELKISVSDLFRFNDKKLIEQKLNAFIMDSLYLGNPSKKFNKKNYSNLNQNNINRMWREQQKKNWDSIPENNLNNQINNFHRTGDFYNFGSYGVHTPSHPGSGLGY